MKKIIILTAGFGEGHNSAARGLRDGLKAIAPEASVAIHDIFAETYGPLNTLTCRLYLAAIDRAPNGWATVYRFLDRRRDFRLLLSWLIPARRRLRNLIRQEQPDLLVGVYPAYGHMLDRIAGPSTGRKPRRVVLVTDSITVNAIWIRCSTDRFILANEETAEVLREAGISPDLIHVAGFPVNPCFANPALRHLRPAGPPWRILHMINASKKAAPALVRRLAAIPNCELTLMVGRDEDLRARMEEVRESLGASFEIVGWANNLPELLSKNHILIGKAGGATVQEAIAARCPMIINQVVPGQEEGNAQLIARNQAGAIAPSPETVVATVEAAIANNGQHLQEWSANISVLSRPDAALRLAEYLVAM